MFSLRVFVAGVCMLCGALAQTSTVCPDYDSSKIKLVTFDCFAALMQWENSMYESVAEVMMPQLTQDQVYTLVQKWESAYGSYMQNGGTVFEEGVTGAFPFSWMAATSLKDIGKSMDITFTRDEFHELMLCWGRLLPWNNTQETLETLVANNFTIAILSNGDTQTLSNAATVFKPPVEFSYIFSSDFPVGAFKPQSAIYYQVLDRTQFKVEEVLHVAGGASDGGGARDAGEELSFEILPFSRGLFSAVLHSTSFAEPQTLQSTQPCFDLPDITYVPGILGL